MEQKKSSASKNSDTCAPDSSSACDTPTGQSGPPTDPGGTTGAGNASAQQASRTGGATGGTPVGNAPPPAARRGVKPDAR